jgi:phosphoglycolate phosphatase/pyrophosphatase PpaX
LIFDLDGTIADTIPVCCAAFREAISRHTGRVLRDAEIVALFGPSEEGIIHGLVGDGWEACLESYLVAYEREHVACPAAFDGLSELLDGLRRRGLRLGVVTGKGARSAAITLRLLGLADQFDAVETGSPQGAVKPAALRRIAARWGLEPAQIAYLGDAPTDMYDARAAGVLPLAAAWASTADRAALQAAAPCRLFTGVDQFVEWSARHACA